MDNFSNAFAQKILEISKLNPLIENEKDYWVEDILHCGECHEPKMAYHLFLGEKLKVTCLCKCQREEFDREQVEKAETQRQARIADLRRKAFETPAMANYTFESSDKNHPMLKGCKNWVDDFLKAKKEHKEIKGLLFAGNKGTGKSYLATCIANAIIDEEYPVVHTNFAQIEKELKGYNSKDYIYNLIQCNSLLIIDDLGIERDSAYMKEIVYQIIDGLYNSHKPLIVTTNLTFQEIWGCKDTDRARIYDRVLEMCVPIEFKGKSYRREDIGKKVAKYKQDWGFE